MLMFEKMPSSRGNAAYAASAKPEKAPVEAGKENYFYRKECVKALIEDPNIC